MFSFSLLTLLLQFIVFEDVATQGDEEDELSVYLKLPPCPVDQGILAFWKEKQYSLPKTTKLARKVLAIPATSTSSERVFSQSGAMLTERRARLGPNVLEKLVFLKYNMKI